MAQASAHQTAMPPPIDHLPPTILVQDAGKAEDHGMLCAIISASQFWDAPNHDKKKIGAGRGEGGLVNAGS